MLLYYEDVHNIKIFYYNTYMKNCIICGNALTGNQSKYCSNNCKAKGHYNDMKNNTNTTYSQTKRALERKLELIAFKGGACIKCGYNRNSAALEFHHRDSEDKKFGLDSRKLSNTKMSALLIEVDKCDLLCSNCHKELHYPDLTISAVSN